MSELTKAIKVSTEVHQDVGDGCVHIRHIATPSNPKDSIIHFSFSMDIVSAGVFATQIQVAIEKIHANHANSLPDKIFNVPSGRSHA